MDDSRSTYSVLVVSAAAKFHTSLRELLPEDRYAPLCAASSVAEARRALLERPFDIVIISAPLPDEFGTKLALHIIDKSSAGVLLLVKAEHYPDLSARLSPQGILLLQKPTSPPLLLQSLQLLCGTRERLRRMEQKTATIEEKMAEIRLVNRAKWQLIDQRGMTEQDAHRYIEKAGHGSLRHPPRRGGRTSSAVPFDSPFAGADNSVRPVFCHSVGDGVLDVPRRNLR